MALEVRIEEVAETELPPVEYRWDADTEILCAFLRTGGVSEGLTGAMDIEGNDGAWITLELTDGRLKAVEIAVWPDVKSVQTLELPPIAGTAQLRVPSTDGAFDLEAVEVETAIRAVADAPERTIHFRIGPTRASRAMRIAHDLLIEVDSHSRIAGLWFLNVPPFPAK